MIQRGGDVVIRMVAHVHQVTLTPLIHATRARGTCVDTDADEIDSRLAPGGDAHESGCQSRGE